jgi:hypothetical protein
MAQLEMGVCEKEEEGEVKAIGPVFLKQPEGVESPDLQTAIPYILATQTSEGFWSFRSVEFLVAALSPVSAHVADKILLATAVAVGYLQYTAQLIQTGGKDEHRRDVCDGRDKYRARGGRGGRVGRGGRSGRFGRYLPPDHAQTQDGAPDTVVAMLKAMNAGRTWMDTVGVAPSDVAGMASWRTAMAQKWCRPQPHIPNVISVNGWAEGDHPLPVVMDKRHTHGFSCIYPRADTHLHSRRMERGRWLGHGLSAREA